MDTFEALYERRSTRDFNPEKKIPEDIIQKIMSVVPYALTAPSGNFTWKIIVVRDQPTKQLLADCAREVAKVMFGSSFEIFGPGHLWYLPPDTRLRVAENTTTGELWEYPRDADVVFIPCLCRGGTWTDCTHPFTVLPEIMDQFVGYPTMSMWLMGHSLGVGVGYNGMPLLDVRRRESVSESLGIPMSWEPTGAFSFGYGKAKRFFGPTRPTLEGAAFSEYWGNGYIRMGLGEEKYETPKWPRTDLEETIKNINFVHSFQENVSIPPWMLESVIDTAIWGPVPENFKNWRFLIVKSKAAKEFLASIVAERERTPFFFNWPEMQYARTSGIDEPDRLEEVEKVYARGLGKWLKQADTLVIALSCFDQWRDQPDPGSGVGRMAMLSISTACCIQNMMIAATALGLGMNYDVLAAGDTRSRELILEYFGIPASSWIPLGILGLGMPGEKVKAVRRPPLETLFFANYWGNAYPFKHK